jgi:uncharacterized membrane protein
MNDPRIKVPKYADIGAQGDANSSAKTLTLIVYGLQAVSFLLGITFVAAVIVNYIKRQDVVGTWLESHFRWQIRTFWYSVLWAVIGFLLAFVVIGYAILFAAAVWLVYRIVKGLIRLSENRPMYEEAGPAASA